MKRSAGILAVRRVPGGVEVFLVHPGGPYWKNKDAHAWSIPKGEFTDEAPEAAARREFQEETGQMLVAAELVALPPIRGSGKEIHAFVADGGAPDPAALRSNVFELEWPPKSGRMQSFPEVDRAAWFSIEQARTKIHKGQQALLDELVAWLDRSERAG